jgi:VCBS repeat protein/FG-GAP repeat protein
MSFRKRGSLLSMVLGASLCFGRALPAADCNGNGIDDTKDIAPQNFGFLGGRGYFVGSHPVSLITGDFNGDGKPDIATANSDSGDVSVLINGGEGTFNKAVNYSVGSDPQSLVSADLNGDGSPDLVTACYSSGEVAILLNAGDGTFRDALIYPAGSNPDSLIAADFNGDGKPDLGTAGYGSGEVSVILNSGDGIFQAPVKYPVGLPSDSLVVSDFNGDGKPDLATANTDNASLGSISILINQGDGTFKGAVKYPVGSNPRSLIAADFNGDGKPDIAAGSYGSDDVSVLINQGDGTFKEAARYPIGSYPYMLVIADFNGDGKPDIATTGALLLNRGDGTFQGVPYTVFGDGFSLVAADFNGDGKPDIAMDFSGGWGICVLFNRGDGTFEVPRKYLAASGFLITSDFDGDGKPDLATLGDYNQVTVLINLGGGILQDAANYTLGSDSGALSLISADLNGDEMPDLATGNNGESLSVFINQSGGKLHEAVNYPVDCCPFALIAADLNGDGKSDLATASDGNISVLLNRGDGTFREGVKYPGGGRHLIAADFSGDGMLDLLTSDFLLLNIGDGTFQSAGTYPSAGGTFLVAADFDHDGTMDLIRTDSEFNGDGNTLSVLLNQGDGTFQDAISYSIGERPQSLIAADFNGDGKPDIATSNFNYSQDGLSTGHVSVLLNRGDGTLKDALRYSVGHSPQSLIVADLNSDGEIDLATVNIGSGNVSILLNQGAGTFNDAVQHPVGGSPGSLVVTDINGDGRPDLATSSITGGGVSVLLNEGHGTFQDALAYAPFPGPLMIAVDLRGKGMPDLAGAGEGISLLFNTTTPPFSLDLNHDSIPDECETIFHRGDPNTSGTTDISDGIAIFGFLFLGDPPTLSCRESADANNDGTIDITDGIYLLKWLFADGPEPAAPGPTDLPCGFDPDPPGSPGDLGCESYSCK